MYVKTEAIALHSIRYGEADLIVKLFTKKEGIYSYLIKGLLKSKKGKIKTSFFQPLSILDVDAIHYNKNTLHRLKDAKLSYYYKDLHINIIKGGITSFISEILIQAFQNNEPDLELFNFLKKSFIWLDEHSNYALFNQLFLLQLTSFIGFYPDTSNIELPQFNLAEGIFEIHSQSSFCINNTELKNFKTLLGINFDNLKTITMPKMERLQLLDNILLYYELHIEGFKQPKSVSILKGLFS